MLVIDVYHYVLFVARFGTFLVCLWQVIPGPIRFLTAITICLSLYSSILPDISISSSQVISAVLSEIVIGAMMAGFIRILFSCLDIAGELITMLGGLSMAHTLNPGGASTTSVSVLIMIMAISLFIEMDGHKALILALKNSYEYVPIGSMPSLMSVHLPSRMGDISLVAMQLSGPFIFYAMIFNFCMGILNRLSPNIQVYFISMPAQICIFLGLLFLSLPYMMQWFYHNMERWLLL